MDAFFFLLYKNIMDILKQQLEINEALVSERFKTLVDIQNKYKCINVITSIYEADYLKAKQASKDIRDKIEKLHQEQELAEELDQELGLPSAKKRKNPDITKVHPIAKRPRRNTRINYEESDDDDEEEEAEELEEQELIDVVSSDDDDYAHDTETKRLKCPIRDCSCSYKFLAWLKRHIEKKHPTYNKPAVVSQALKRDGHFKFALKNTTGLGKRSEIYDHLTSNQEKLYSALK